MRLTHFFQHGLIGTDRRVEAVDRAWPVVELVGNRVELHLVVNRHIGALGQALSDQSVDVLAASTLPRALRFPEVDLDARVGAQLRMPRHLLTLVIPSAPGASVRQCCAAWP